MTTSRTEYAPHFDLKTAADIRAYHEEMVPDSHFFDRDTLKFFGDTMSNFGVFTNNDGLRCIYRKHPVKHGLTGSWRLEFDGRLTKI